MAYHRRLKRRAERHSRCSSTPDIWDHYTRARLNSAEDFANALLDKPHTADVRAVERSEFHVADAAALLATDPAATLYIAAILSPPRTKCTLGNSPRHGTWSVREKLVCCGCGTRGSYPQLVFFNAGEPPTIGRSAQTSLLSIQKLHPDLQDKSLGHSSRLSSR